MLCDHGAGFIILMVLHMSVLSRIHKHYNNWVNMPMVESNMSTVSDKRSWISFGCRRQELSEVIQWALSLRHNDRWNFTLPGQLQRVFTRWQRAAS